MTLQSWLNAMCYELGLWAATRRPSLVFQEWFKQMMANCRPDWAEWRTRITMEKVDKEAKALVQQWEEEDKSVVAGKLAEKAQELFPNATITPLPHAVVPSVMIEHPAPNDASDEVRALGGEMRITWLLGE